MQLSVYPFIHEASELFHLLDTITNAARDRDGQRTLRALTSSLCNTPERRDAGSRGRAASLTLPRTCAAFPPCFPLIPPRQFQRHVLTCLFYGSRPSRCGWHLTAVLICISLATVDAQRLLLQPADCTWSSVVKCLFQSFAHFTVCLFIFFYLNRRLIFMYTKQSQIYIQANCVNKGKQNNNS